MPTRRTLLTTLAALATTGCNTTPTPTPTPTPTATAPETIRIDNLQISSGTYEPRNYLRYYDSTTDELKQLQPTNGRWIYVSLSYDNLGGPTDAVPGYDQTKLAIGPTTYTTTRNPLPIDWEALRLRDTGTAVMWFNTGIIGIPTELNGGQGTLAGALYDAEPPDDQPVRLYIDTAEKRYSVSLRNAHEPVY